MHSLSMLKKLEMQHSHVAFHVDLVGNSRSEHMFSFILVLER